MSPPTIATANLVALPRPVAPNNSLATTLAHSVASNALPLDQLVPDAIWQSALLGPLLEFAARPSKAFRDRLTQLAFLGSICGSAAIFAALQQFSDYSQPG